MSLRLPTPCFSKRRHLWIRAPVEVALLWHLQTSGNFIRQVERPIEQHRRFSVAGVCERWHPTNAVRIALVRASAVRPMGRVNRRGQVQNPATARKLAVTWCAAEQNSHVSHP